MSGLESLGVLRTSVRSRSITAENTTGEPGGGGRATDGPGARSARELGPGWKIAPCYDVAGGEAYVLADITGPGRITHIWMTLDPDWWRRVVLRVWWDGADQPAVDVPVGDFFAQGWSSYAPVVSTAIAVNPHGGLNSYWSMPFSSRARIELHNVSDEPVRVFYQIDYETSDEPLGDAYLHAVWRRSNPTAPGGPHEILPRIEGSGHYAGTYLAWSPSADGWWGEGEVKVYLDGDRDYPTICGTGTEDYFGGAWNFDVPGEGYTRFSGPYAGLPQVDLPDGLYRTRPRFGMYRWHIPDPIRFTTDVRIDVQALGWNSRGRYLPASDDVASTAMFYLDSPEAAAPCTIDLEQMQVFLGAGVSSR